MIKFGVMVVLYHPDQKAMRNIERYGKLFSSIFVYDNTPGSCTKDRYTFQEPVTYDANGKNDGMSAALTKGFQWAKDMHLDFLLTMDQDSEFANSEIAAMMDEIQNNPQRDIAIYCPNYRKIYSNKRTGASVCTPPKLRTSQIKDIEACMTSGSFVDVAKMQECLPLDNLFIGMVDYDICYMLRLKGYKIRMVGKAILSQQVGAVVSNGWFSRMLHKIVLSEKRYYYMGRNLTYLMRKYKGCNKILGQLGRIKWRILLNLILCEEHKRFKYRYWIKGTREKCPPFQNIG